MEVVRIRMPNTPATHGDIDFIVKMLDTAEANAKEWRQATTQQLAAMAATTASMTTTDAVHGARIGNIEAWRATEVDPTLDRVRARESELTGGKKVVKTMGYAATAAVSAGGVAWGPKIVAFLTSLFH